MLFFWVFLAAITALGIYGLTHGLPSWSIAFAFGVPFTPAVVFYGLSAHFPHTPKYKIDGTVIPPPKWGVIAHKTCNVLAVTYLAAILGYGFLTYLGVLPS